MDAGYFEKIYLLGRISTFRRLAAETLAKVAERFRIVRLEKGSPVFIQDKPVNSLFVLGYGRVQVKVDGREVGASETGALIGDHEILTDATDANATVVVSSKYAQLLEISRAEFLDLMGRQPDLAMGITRELAHRHNHMRRRLRQGRSLRARISRALQSFEGSLDAIRTAAEGIAQKSQAKVIERRFLATVEDSALVNATAQVIRQGYVAVNRDGDEIRVRYDGSDYTITGKKDYGDRKFEISLPLDERLFETLYAYSGNRVIAKRRIVIDYQHRQWRVDFFDADTPCHGLIIAEVEIREGEDTLESPPGVNLTRDISEDLNYRNRNLAIQGLPRPPAGGPTKGST